ncbi:unnamed protein product, partial [Urochloa humidicola]
AVSSPRKCRGQAADASPPATHIAHPCRPGVTPPLQAALLSAEEETAAREPGPTSAPAAHTTAPAGSDLAAEPRHLRRSARGPPHRCRHGAPRGSEAGIDKRLPPRPRYPSRFPNLTGPRRKPPAFICSVRWAQLWPHGGGGGARAELQPQREVASACLLIMGAALALIAPALSLAIIINPRYHCSPLDSSSNKQASCSTMGLHQANILLVVQQTLAHP